MRTPVSSFWHCLTNQADILSVVAWFRTTDGQVFVVDPRRPINMDRVSGAEDNQSEQEKDAPKISPRGTATAPLLKDTPIAPIVETAAETFEVGEGDAGANGQYREQGDEGEVVQPEPIIISDDDSSDDRFSDKDSNAVQPDAPADDQDAGVVDKMTKTGGVEDDLCEDGDLLEDDYLTLGEESVLASHENPGRSGSGEAELAELVRTVQARLEDFLNTEEDFCSTCKAFAWDHAAYCPNRR